MALKGKLRDFKLTQLLNLIHLARKTGALSIDSAEGHADLYFHEGKLIYATLAEQPGTLADLMVRAGKLTQNQATSIQASGRVRDDKQLGLLLINAGQISKGDIVQTVRNHLMEVVQQLFGWGDGTFVFDQKVTPPAGRITIPVAVDTIIVEGSRQREETEDLQDELPSLDVILKFTDGPGSNLRDINLSVEEWKVISFVNPRNTIEMIARFNQMSEFQVRKIVAKLLRDNLVEVVGTTPAPPVPAVAPAPTRAGSPQPTARPALQTAAADESQPSFATPEVGRGIIRRLIDRIKGL